MASTASALFLTTDLIFTSRIAGAARAVGGELNTVATVGALVELADARAVRLVILDLGQPNLDPHEVVRRLRALPTPPGAIIAYASHVHENVLAAARDAGCDEVFSRGQFHSQAEQILARYLATSSQNQDT